MPEQAIAFPKHVQEKLLQEASESLIHIVARPPQVMLRGQGSYIWDAAGRKYLDFVQGWAVNCLGHSPRVLVQALSQQARTLINGSPAYFNAPMIELARELTTHSALDEVFFGSSGAEANEGAVKLARRYGEKHLHGAHEIITTWNGFHGRTLTTMAASGKAAWDALFEPKTPGFIRVEYGDLEALKQRVTKQTCAVMVEPVQGEAGVILPPAGYLEGLRALCDERGILLILDEIQTGMGRLGSLFGYERFGVVPDIMTLGKGLGGGFPVSALLARRTCSVFSPGDQGGTFCAQPLAMVAGLTVLRELIKRNIPKRALQRGEYLRKCLRALSVEFGFTEVRGMGLLVAVELSSECAAAVSQAAFQRGLLLNAPRPSTLRFMPALTVSNTEINAGLEILSDSLRSVSA